MFAVLALPVMAFAEAGDSMSNQATIQHSGSNVGAKPDTYACKEGNKAKCLQKARKRSLKLKHNEINRNEHADGSEAKEAQ
jgi:hypothetical protein